MKFDTMTGVGRPIRGCITKTQRKRDRNAWKKVQGSAWK